MRALGVVVIVVAACGGHASPPAVLPPVAPRLPAPPPGDPDALGAAYLAGIAAHLQPAWGQFLDDCRLRLPATHPLNTPSLAATAELAIDRAGHLVDVRIATSGNADFDLAVREILAEAPQLVPPPLELLSDDDQAHLRWLFARDRRQAGPATAAMVAVALPVAQVTERLLGQGELARAARRVVATSATDPDRAHAAERVMIAALHEALSSGGAARPAAVEAIGRAGVRSLASEVRALLAPTIDTDLRLLAIGAVGALGDEAAVPALLTQLPLDLPAHPRLAVAETSALVALGHRDEAAAAIRVLLEERGAREVAAFEAHALAPSPSLAPRLAAWFARGDAAVREAVCSAIAAEQPDFGVILRGLRDADARVRATCVDAAARVFKPLAEARRAAGRPGITARDPLPASQTAIIRRLLELAKDRDAVVRARAVRAVAVLDPSRHIRAATDAAPEVRVAAASTASDAEQRALAADPDAEVRAAAVAVLADRAPEVVLEAAHDRSAQVRRAAIAWLVDEDTLQQLAHDASPDVATAALVRLTARRGRAAMTAPLLTQLVGAPAGSAERVRIALAWLLGP